MIGTAAKLDLIGWPERRRAVSILPVDEDMKGVVELYDAGRLKEALELFKKLRAERANQASARALPPAVPRRPVLFKGLILLPRGERRSGDKALGSRGRLAANRAAAVNATSADSQLKEAGDFRKSDRFVWWLTVREIARTKSIFVIPEELLAKLKKLAKISEGGWLIQGDKSVLVGKEAPEKCSGIEVSTADMALLAGLGLGKFTAQKRKTAANK